MLSNIIFNLCNILALPYNNENFQLQNNYIFNNMIKENIYLRKLFNFQFEKKLNSNFHTYNFYHTYDIIEQNSKFIKLKLKLFISFINDYFTKSIKSVSIDNYLLIIEYLNNKFQIQSIVNLEENPIYYYFLLNNSLYTDTINNDFIIKSNNLYTNKLSSINHLLDLFKNYTFSECNKQDIREISNFSISEACDYAQKYALNYNPNYKSFENMGGDCTNFMSQILHAGGFRTNNTWKPYTHPWIRVEELYNYLFYSNLGVKKIKNDYYLDKGSLIQFYTPSIGRYFHNGFITYKLENNDCLYCCHSYDKLNYPLSKIYPVIYPKLRALKFN